MWSDLAIYWTLGNFLKPLATINLPKSPRFLGNFSEGVTINHFSSEIIFGQLLYVDIWRFFSGHIAWNPWDVPKCLVIAKERSPQDWKCGLKRAGSLTGSIVCTTTLKIRSSDSVTRCWIKKVPKRFPKVALMISAVAFTLIDLFQNNPKVNNLFGLLLGANLLPRTLKIAHLVSLLLILDRHCDPRLHKNPR